jgi:hypothetical protein
MPTGNSTCIRTTGTFDACNELMCPFVAHVYVPKARSTPVMGECVCLYHPYTYQRHVRLLLWENVYVCNTHIRTKGTFDACNERMYMFVAHVFVLQARSTPTRAVSAVCSCRAASPSAPTSSGRCCWTLCRGASWPTSCTTLRTTARSSFKRSQLYVFHLLRVR